MEGELCQLGPIFAGEVHYSRIPVEYWEHRILMIKALGLNALSVYIMWNYHEMERGKYDFSSGNKNLPLFLELAEKHEMMVLFRPGPYVCAEWDLGGLPARLYTVEGIVFRANNTQFLEQTKVYFEALAPIMKKHLRTKQDPKKCIVMLQIENEYGFYGTDKSYMEAIRAIWHDLGINCHEYYVDWLENIKKCHWEGANIGINDFSKLEQEEYVRSFEKKGMILGGQIYSGWMTHWTEKWGGKKIEKVIQEYKFLCERGHSFAMYVVHGGTNFGLTAGANGLKDKQNDYWGAITSYDYDAPINEQGSPTQKYHALRQLFSKYVKWPVPDIPNPIPMIEIPEIKMQPVACLLQNLPSQFYESEQPLAFETPELQMFNQGIVVYQASIRQKKQYNLNVVVHDYALVYIGRKLIGTLDRTKKTHHQLKITEELQNEHGSQVWFVVEASGHINFDTAMETDQKGLFSIQGAENGDLSWKMWKFPVEYGIVSSWKASESDETWGSTYPRVYSSQFELQEVGDVYFDMSSYGKGYLWINGVNLGRYWNVGIQQRLFCPGVWLKKGPNRLTVLNIFGDAGAPIQGVKELYDTPICYDQ